MKPTLLIALILTATALAGCVGDEAPKAALTDDNTAPADAEEAEATAETGSLKGLVSDDLFDPISGASVTVVNSEDGSIMGETKVAKNGAYTINNLLPGRHNVFVTHFLYHNAQRPVTIVAGEIAQADFTMLPLPSDDPWIEMLDWAGLIGAAVSWDVEVPGEGCFIYDAPVRDIKTCSGTRTGGSNGEQRYEVTNDTKTLLAEIKWSPAGPLGEALQFDLMCPLVPRGNSGAVLDDQHVCYFGTDDYESPIIHRVDEEHWLTNDYNFTGEWASRVFGASSLPGLGLGADVGAAYQQSFHVYVTIAHKEPLPPDYTGMPEN